MFNCDLSYLSVEDSDVFNRESWPALFKINPEFMMGNVF